MGVYVIIAVIITIFSAGIATYLLQPIAYNMAYGSNSMFIGMPADFQVLKDYLYMVVLATPTVLGLGCTGVWAFVRSSQVTP